MSFAAPLPKESKPRGRLRLPGRFTWPLAFLALAIAAFIFYYLLTMGYLDPSVRDFAQKWMPLGSISANPNPINVTDGTGIGATALSWNSSGTTAVELHINSPSGPLLAVGGAGWAARSRTADPGPSRPRF